MNPVMDLAPHTIRAIVDRALEEDIGTGDLTTLAVIPAEAQAEATLVMREAGIICGLPVLQSVFHAVDPHLQITLPLREGSQVQRGDCVAMISGSARSILTAERVALNLIQRMSGIATLTSAYVAAIQGTKARVLDTRKTTPGLRVLEKYAVRVGGGTNHRFALYDGIMLKDNHLAMLATHGTSLTEAIQRAKAAVGPMVRVEVEVESVAEAVIAAEAGASMILLDNMPPAQMAEAVRLVAGRAEIEASGGITLATIRAAAESGVDYISVGALTHSARALDISLDMNVVVLAR
ncbi:MAG: carboxylating nicotinate-nucleotide diphosphorylase [Roseiflexaceae bacterium]